MTTIWKAWLPDPVREEIREHEEHRFARLIQWLKETWNAQKHLDWPHCFEAIGDAFETLYNFLQTKNDFDLQSVETFIEVGMEIIFATQNDFSFLGRYLDAVSYHLRKYKKQLKGKLLFDWRPIYDLCMKIFVDERFVYIGGDAFTGVRLPIFGFIFSSSTYFSKQSCFEIWEMLKPSLKNVNSPECYVALGWLSLFLPSQELDKDMNWDGLMNEWLDLYERVNFNEYWQSHWFDIFARLAKNDKKGLIHWNDHAPRLFTAFLNSFQLPIGTATGEAKSCNVAIPYRAALWFPTKSQPIERSASKCIIYLLRNDSTENTILPSVTKIIDLFEQFCHPSNGGRWTSMLGSFLHCLVKHLVKVIGFQDAFKETRPHLRIEKSTQRVLVEHILKMAARGQFSKTKEMRSYSCQAFRQLAYLEPDLVLPLVYNRFVGAIGSPHAPGTLTSATYALAICLRPMLMHGLNLPDVDPKEAAVQAIAQAMMDVLPGLDANDPSKTTNVFRFYAAVFYSVPSLDPQSGTGIVLPLDVELWAEEFLSRLFVLLENLEGPEAHADQSHTTEKFANAGTFLSKDCVFFDWCIEGFLLKLPKALRLRAIKRIASFLLSTPIPRSSQECEKLCGIMTEVEPAAVVSLIVHPLLQSLLEDLPSTSGHGMNDVALTHALTTQICWKLRLLYTCLNDTGDITVQNFDAICEVIDRASHLKNREIQDNGVSQLLQFTLSGLLSDHPILDNETMAEHILPSGILRWVAKETENWSRPKWNHPTASEIAAAEALVDRYLIRSMTELKTLIENATKGKTSEFEDVCNSLLNKICGVLSGTNQYLVDFEMPEEMKARLASSKDVTSFQIAGDTKIRVGKPGTKEALCDLLVQLSPLLESADPTLLSSLVGVMDYVANIGELNPPDDFRNLSDPDEDTFSIDAHFIEPPIAHPYILQDGSKCLKRRPYYHALARIWFEFDRRMGDAAHLRWHNNVYVSKKTPETVPEAVGRLMGPLFRFVTHPYDEVGDIAHSTLEKLFTRYPVLTTFYQPWILPPLVRLPNPEDLSLPALLNRPDFENEILLQLEGFMKTIEFDLNLKKCFSDEEDDLNVEAERDAGVRGAVMLLHNSFHAWRGVFRYPEKTTRLIYAFIGGRVTTDSETQSYMGFLIWKFFLQRMIVPPYITLEIRVPLIERLRSLLSDVGKEGAVSGWKFSLLANVFLIILLPLDRSQSVEILEHFFTIFLSALPHLTAIALQGIYALIRPVIDQDHSSETPLAQYNLIDDHETDGHQEASRMQGRSLAGSFEEALLKSGFFFSDRFGSWPEGETITAMTNGSYQITHAELIRILGRLAPLELSSALKTTFLELSSRVRAQNDDKHELSTLAELLAGFTASGAPFMKDPETQLTFWEAWYKDVVKEVFSRCSLDYATGAFAVTVRYSAHHLLHAPNAISHFCLFMQALLEFEEKTGTGQSVGEMKKLVLLNNAYREIPQAYAFEDLPSEFDGIYKAVLQLCENWILIGFHSVRKRTASLIVLLSSFILSSSQSVHPELVQKTKDLLTTISERFESGVRSIHSTKISSKDSNADNNAMAIDGEETDFELSDLQSRIGVAVQFVIAAMREKQVLCLAPTLTRLLASIFQIQEVGDPRLKSLQVEAVGSFISIKYLTVDASEIDFVIQILQDAMQYPQWHARCAGLIFLQVFWYQHSLVLTKDQSKTLREMVIRRLEDEKLEVQNTACSTLSGMIKGMDNDEEEELRRHFLAQVRAYYPKRRSQRRHVDSELHQRHGCILGLKAFVISHPYDIPPWMAEVLVAMIPAAHDRNPIKTTLTKTLGDFRTTHKNESPQELRNAFDAETWERIQEVGSQASYFT